MDLSREQVAHIAELAKMSMTDEELDTMARQLSEILAAAARLNELDTGAISPTASVIPNQSVMRPDHVIPSLSLEEVLANAPDCDDSREFIRVRAILEE